MIPGQWAARRQTPEEKNKFVPPSTEPFLDDSIAEAAKTGRNPGRNKNWVSSPDRRLVDHLVIERPQPAVPWANEGCPCQPRPAGSRPASSHRAGQLAGSSPPESRPSLTLAKSCIFVMCFFREPREMYLIGQPYIYIYIYIYPLPDSCISITFTNTHI